MKTNIAMLFRTLMVAVITIGVVDDAMAGYIWSRTGKYLIEKHTDPDVRPFGRTYYVQGDRFRVEHWRVEKGERVVVFFSIFRKDKNITWSVDPLKKQYVERTLAESLALDEKQAQGRRKAEAQAKQAWERTPVEVRATLAYTPQDTITPMEQEQYMRAMQGERYIPTHTIKPMNKTQKVGKWTCDVYEHLVISSKSSELCVIDGSMILPGLADAERLMQEIARSFHAADFLADLMAMDQAEEKALKKARFVVKEIFFYGKDKPVRSSELIEVRNEPVPPNMFDLPPGLTKTDKLWTVESFPLR